MSQQPTPASKTTTPGTVNPFTHPQSQQSPSQFDYSSIPISEIEATRIKLLSLSRSLAKLQDEAARGNRLDPLHNQFNVVITQLGALSAEIFQNYETLASRNVYPLSNFPVTQQEGLLLTLLRKKPSPESLHWVEQAEQFVDKLNINVQKLLDNQNNDEELEDFIDWSLDFMENKKETHNFFSVFTQHEIDNGENKKPHPYKIEKSINDDDRPLPGMDVDQALKFIYQGVL